MTNFGWALVNSDETDYRTFRAFWTKESTDPTLRPELLVTYTVLPGDVNGDNVVNGLDINVIAGHWLATGSNIPGDANFDGVVNGLDINLVAAHWLQITGGGGSGNAVPEPATLIAGDRWRTRDVTVLPTAQYKICQFRRRQRIS